MKITINTEVLKRENLTLNDFLVMLMGYYDYDYRETLDMLISKGIVNRNVFDNDRMILSDNTKNLIAKILTEANDEVVNSGINFMALAKTLQLIFPKGNKPGTTYSWRDNTETIAQKLRTLVAVYHFKFTKEEAIEATKDYVNSFKDKEKMQLLKYFILKTKTSDDIESMFMTLIENNRQQNN